MCSSQRWPCRPLDLPVRNPSAVHYLERELVSAKERERSGFGCSAGTSGTDVAGVVVAVGEDCDGWLGWASRRSRLVWFGGRRCLKFAWMVRTFPDALSKQLQKVLQTVSGELFHEEQMDEMREPRHLSSILRVTPTFRRRQP